MNQAKIQVTINATIYLSEWEAEYWGKLTSEEKRQIILDAIKQKGCN